MFIWTCDRRSLSEWVATRKPLTKSQLRNVKTLDRVSASESDLILVWRDAPTAKFSLPRAVVVPDGSVSDFLAWSLTYLKNIRPLTAQMRVLERSTANSMASAKSDSSWDETSRSIEVGLVLAEAIVLSEGRFMTSRLQFGAYARTLSFAFAQTIRKHSMSANDLADLLKTVEQSWHRSRRITHQPSITLDTSALRRIWIAAFQVCCEGKRTSSPQEFDPTVELALKEVYSEGSMSRQTWAVLSGDSRLGTSLIEKLDGPREARVLAVTEFVNNLEKVASNRAGNYAFMAGFAASRVSVGAFDHFPLLLPLIKSIPESVLWYGVFAGIVQTSEIENFSDGLGWLMRRELSRNECWLDRPHADVAESEISVLFADPDARNPPFRTTVANRLEVELFPMVSTNVSWPNVDRDNERRVEYEQGRLFSEDREDLKADVDELLHSLYEGQKSLEDVRQRIESRFRGKLRRRGR